MYIFMALIILLLFLLYLCGISSIKKCCVYICVTIFLCIGFDVCQLYLRATTYLPIVEYIFCLLYPPENYFKPICEVKLNEKQTKYTLECVCKYRGEYNVALIISSLNHRIGENISIPFKAIVTCSSVQRELNIVKRTDFTLQSWGENYITALCCRFNVPKEFLREERLQITVSFEQKYFKTFIKNNQNIKIVVSKASDE